MIILLTKRLQKKYLAQEDKENKQNTNHVQADVRRDNAKRSSDLDQTFKKILTCAIISATNVLIQFTTRPYLPQR